MDQQTNSHHYVNETRLICQLRRLRLSALTHRSSRRKKCHSKWFTAGSRGW